MDNGRQREFVSGAKRDTALGKLDYEGFLSPQVMEAFAVYMDFNRTLRDGSIRDSDNWQKGIPQDVYMKSAWRHFIDWWRWHRKLSVHENLVWAICGLMFNLQGYLHEQLKKQPHLIEEALIDMKKRREDAKKRDAQPTNFGSLYPVVESRSKP